MRRFGEEFWAAQTANPVPVEVGGYQRREQLENPQQYDRFAQPIDGPTETTNWTMEFPYGS